jgi:hypothetical protein
MIHTTSIQHTLKPLLKILRQKQGGKQISIVVSMGRTQPLNNEQSCKICRSSLHRYMHIFKQEFSQLD